jgi:hypothetical protein
MLQHPIEKVSQFPFISLAKHDYSVFYQRNCYRRSGSFQFYQTASANLNPLDSRSPGWLEIGQIVAMLWCKKEASF